MPPANHPAFLSLATLGWALLLLATAWSLRSARETAASPAIGWKWWVLTAAALLCLRWPMLWVQHQLNPDESQLIAGVLTLRHDPVFWRAVDGSTAGPFDFYPLLPAAWADGFASYAAARLIALAVVFGTFVFAGETLALVAGPALARIALLPALSATAFTTTPDFAHYSTELMPALLLAVAGYVAVRQRLAPRPGQLWLAAVLLGCVPWAKLQGIPFAAGLWLIVAASEYRAGRPRSLIPLLAGALLPALLCFAGAAVTGQAEHLIKPYVLRNVIYVGQPHFSIWEDAAGQWQNALTDGYLGFWLTGAALCLVPLALWKFRAAPVPARRVAFTAALLLLLGIFTALAPRRASAHHLQFVPLPLLWLTGAALALGWPEAEAPDAARRRLRLAGVFLFCTLAPQLGWRAAGIDSFAAINAAGVNPDRRQLTELIRKYSQPDEPLAVWGWRCSLYVEAHRRQATRQAQSEAQIWDSPLQPYYLRRYFEDFQAANPPVFADAVGPGNYSFVDRALGHECFPPLRDRVRTQYTLVADLDGARLYVRNDRFAALRPAAP